jgi:ABC-type amino acid transport substrate-binding protein
MNINLLRLSALITILLLGYLFITREYSAPAHPHVLIVGTAAGYAPFVSINQDGAYEGFDIDVANALAQTMNKQLAIKDLGSMSALLVALEQGSIDAIIWGMSITADRLEKVAMVHYQGATTDAYPLIFWQTIPEGITSIADMQQAIISVEQASAQDSALRAYTHIRTLPVEKVDDALLNIQYGKAHAALVEPAIARKFKAKFPEIKILDVPLTTSDVVHGIGIVLKKGRTQLITQVQQAVDTLKAQGRIAELEQTWDIAS